MLPAWQRYMSADVAGASSGDDVTAAYCPVCSPVYAAGAWQYQRYVPPRRPDLDVFRAATHSPDLLGPLSDTSQCVSYTQTTG